MIAEATFGADFGGLQRYLTHDRNHKVVLLTGVACVSTAALEMAMVAGERPRVRRPVLHISLSFAPEDSPRISDQLALSLFDEIDRALGLSGHQGVVVRHYDTHHPHYHRSTNIVHPETFETPPDRPNRAMTDPNYQRRPSRKRPPRPLSWDAFILPRLAAVCDRFAKKHGLRRVAQPVQAAAGEKELASPRPPIGALRREERTGIKSLLEQADELRAALASPTWLQRASKLRELGVRLNGAEVVRHGTAHLRGLRLVKIADPANAIKASSLGSAYGLAALDRSITPGCPDFSTWWSAAKHAPVSLEQFARDTVDAHGSLQEDYRRRFQLYEEDQRWQRERAKANRKVVKAEHGRQRALLTSELAKERKAVLAGVPRQFLSEARRSFRLRFAEPRRAALKREHGQELAWLRAPPKMTWANWLLALRQAGDGIAGEILDEMRRRHRRQGHRSKQVNSEIVEPQCDHSAYPEGQPSQGYRNDDHTQPGRAPQPGGDAAENQDAQDQEPDNVLARLTHGLRRSGSRRGGR